MVDTGEHTRFVFGFFIVYACIYIYIVSLISENFDFLKSVDFLLNYF